MGSTLYPGTHLGVEPKCLVMMQTFINFAVNKVSGITRFI